MSESQDPQDIDDQLLEQILEQFIPEAREIIDHLNLCLIQLDQDLKDEALIETVTRGFHTLKGSSGFAGLDQLSFIAKSLENYMKEVKKGDLSLSPSAVNMLYEGLDALSALVDKAEAKDSSEIDAKQLLEKIEALKTGDEPEPTDDSEEAGTEVSHEFEEMLKVYRDGYNQLVALKHLIFSSIHLSDPETLSVHFSSQIHERLEPIRNSIWLVDPEDKLVEVARDGKAVAIEERRILKSDYSEVLQRVLHEQLIVWPSDSPMITQELPEYHSPVIFPIKIKTAVLGLLILDPEEKAELELYQFITQFAAMMISISKLHHKVDEQRKALDDMTGILFKQNAHLSALYHVEMDLMQEKDPIALCKIVVEALVTELDAVRAAAFIYNSTKKEFVCAAESGGYREIVGKAFPLTAIRAFQQALETGRLVAHIDYGEVLSIGPNQLDNWIVLGLKGREKIHGIMVVETGDEEISDAISIITNYCGVLLDNVLLSQAAKKA